jgi:hypothetical protein
MAEDMDMFFIKDLLFIVIDFIGFNNALKIVIFMNK